MKIQSWKTSTLTSPLLIETSSATELDLLSRGMRSWCSISYTVPSATRQTPWMHSAGYRTICRVNLSEKIMERPCRLFFWGLPESMFDAAISWSFLYHYPERRQDMFPSWSWLGRNFCGTYVGYG